MIHETYAGEAVADPVLRQRVVTDTLAYWEAIGAGRWQAAYDRFTDDYQEDMPFAEWRTIRHDAWAVAPRIKTIRWTKAAHRHHGPELYAVVDWTARTGSSGSEGRLVWRQEPDGTFLLENTIVRALVRPPGG